MNAVLTTAIAAAMLATIPADTACAKILQGDHQSTAQARAMIESNPGTTIDLVIQTLANIEGLEGIVIERHKDTCIIRFTSIVYGTAQNVNSYCEGPSLSVYGTVADQLLDALRAQKVRIERLYAGNRTLHYFQLPQSA